MKFKNRTLGHLIKSAFQLFLGAPLSIIFYLSKYLPKNENIWIFSSYNGDVFRDNGKYSFLYVANNYPKIKSVWISKNKNLVKILRENGYNAFYNKSLKGIYFCLRAKYCFYDYNLQSISRYFANGTLVFMPHGLPLKKSQYANKSPSSLMYPILYSKGIKRFFFKIIMPFVFRNPDYMVSTSPIVTEKFGPMFRVDKKNIFETGLPRNDSLLKKIKGEKIFVDNSTLEKIMQAKSEQKKIIMYMPTFRDTGDLLVDEIINLEKLDMILEKNSGLMILKLHELSSIAKIIRETKLELNNIITCEPKSDAYPLLRETDILITDYSSVYFDFLLLQRPIIFYAYDLEKFINKDRQLFFDYDNRIIPGKIVKNSDELYNHIEFLLINDDDEFQEKRKEMLNLFFTHHDSDSSKRLVSKIFDIKNITK